MSTLLAFWLLGLLVLVPTASAWLWLWIAAPFVVVPLLAVHWLSAPPRR